MITEQTRQNAEHALNVIAIESFSVSSALKDFVTKFLPFREVLKESNFVTNDTPVLSDELSKEQRKIAMQLTGQVYMKIRDLQVPTLPHWSANVTDSYRDIQDFIKLMKEFNSNVINPYYTYLSVFISNAKARVDTKDDSFKYDKLKKNRELTLAHHANLFKEKSGSGSIVLHEIFARSADIALLFNNSYNVRREYDCVDFRAIKDGIQKCVEVIDVILVEAKNGTIADISPEVMQNMTKGAYEIAQQAELIAVLATTVIGYISMSDNMVKVLQQAQKDGVF